MRALLANVCPQLSHPAPPHKHAPVPHSVPKPEQATPPAVGKGDGAQKAESWTASKAGLRSPDAAASATGTGVPSVGSQEQEDLARDESAPRPAPPVAGAGAAAGGAAALGAAGTDAAHQNVWDWRREVHRCRAQGGAVKAIVSADYNGEIKFFLGFLAAGSEGVP